VEELPSVWSAANQASMHCSGLAINPTQASLGPGKKESQIPTFVLTRRLLVRPRSAGMSLALRGAHLGLQGWDCCWGHYTTMWTACSQINGTWTQSL